MAGPGANSLPKRSFAAGATQCGVLQFEATDLTVSPIPDLTKILPPLLHFHLQIIDLLLHCLVLMPQLLVLMPKRLIVGE